jgi:hypothetical protein
MRFQEMGKVVVLFETSTKLIRDGPIQRVQPSNELWQADDRKAA